MDRLLFTFVCALRWKLGPTRVHWRKCVHNCCLVQASATKASLSLVQQKILNDWSILIISGIVQCIRVSAFPSDLLSYVSQITALCMWLLRSNCIRNILNITYCYFPSQFNRFSSDNFKFRSRHVSPVPLPLRP